MTNSTKLPPPDIDTSNGMILDGVFASEVWDSSGEVLDVAGCDISDMEEGRGVANYEHRNDESEGATGQDIVGKIIYAKKILKESDATDERQKMFWRKVKVPFIYGMVRLYDGAGHLSAQGLAAQIRDHVKHDEPIIVRFSIDGSTIERKGNRLSSTLGRRVALTIKPANKTCDSGLVVDPNAPEGFEKKPMSLVKSEDPMYGRLGSGGDIEQHLPDQALLRKAAAANKQEMQARQRLLAQMAAMQAEEAAPAAPPAAKSTPAPKPPAKASSSGVWESEDGLVIPKHGTPERQRWDQRFMSGIQQAFGRGKPTTIDVASAMNLNGVRNYNRFNLYKEMAAAGDPLPPVVVRQTPYGVEVVDGNHRHHAAKAAGVSTMSAVDITGVQQKPMKKAMTAGGTDAAPGTLTGGAALQKEDVRRKIVNVVKAYDEKSGVSLREFLKNELPDVSDEYIDHFADLADELRAKLKKSADWETSVVEFEDDIDTLAKMAGPLRTVPHEQLVGKRVKVYRNLHNGLFSVHDGQHVIAHIPEIHLTDVKFHVNEGGRQRVIKEKRKNVHAFVIGTVAQQPHPDPGQHVTYNPYMHPAEQKGSFVLSGDKSPVATAPGVTMKIVSTPDGKQRAHMEAHGLPAAAGAPVQKADPGDRMSFIKQATNRSVENTVSDIWGDKGGGNEAWMSPADPPPAISPTRDVSEVADIEFPPKGPDPKKGKAALAATPGVEVGSAPGTIEADVADDDPIPAKGALTIRGKAVTPNPHVKKGKLHFNEHTGELHLPQATYKMYNPDEDGESGRHFREVWHSPEVRKQHDYAVRNWIEVNKALKEGRLPEAVLATSVAFSQLSPNTPVPVHEMMYAYLLDTFKNKGYDIRDPRFGTPETKQDWMSRDQPQNWPTSSRDYFTDQIGGLVSLKNASKRTGRKVGDRPGFMLPNDKFSNMSNYSAVHGFLRDLVERHGADTRSAVAELMKGKVSAKLWEAARQRALKTGKPDIGEYRGLNIPGLAPKTARFAYSMLGAGNSFVPDTHFSRHLFGLDKKLDGSSIGQVRDKVLWNENNSDLLNAMDRWYYRNHPSVKLMLEHPEFGQYFKDNPEQAVFPAFWGHWLSIAPHEARLGHKMANVASNQSASHRPLFDEVTRLLADPRESANVVPARTSPLPTSPATAPNAEAVYPPPKARAPRVKKSENEGDQQHDDDGPLIDPRVAAGLMASWVREHGEGAALFYFYTHLIPLLMHGHDKPAHDDEGHVLIKAEALSVDVALIADALQKADAEGYSETPPQRPQKQKPRQQAAQNTHQAMLMMAGNAMKQQAGEAASEAPSPPGMPSGPTWAHLVLAGKGWGGDDRAQAQAALDYYHKNKDRTLRHVPEFDKLNSSPEQRQLVDGLDLSEKNHVARPAHASDPGDHINGQWSVWATHPTLQSRVFAKGDANSYGSGAHRGAVREVAYHNLARDFFGLGDYVPTTAVGKMVNGEAWSVMMPVKDAEHYSGSQRQHDIIKALGDRGELHKLAIMNFITGNNDRHHHNYLFDKHGIKLIDHGHTFADPFARGLRVPRYLQHYERLNPHARTMHPEAAKWLDSLDSQKLTEQALRYFGPEMAGKMGMALTMYKRMYGAARSNGQLPYGLLRSINHSTDDQAMRDSMGRRLGAIDAGQVWTPMDVRKQFLRSEDKPPFWRGASFGTPDMRKRP